MSTYQYPLKVPKELIDKLREDANNNSRSLNKHIEFILKQYISSQNVSQDK